MEKLVNGMSDLFSQTGIEVLEKIENEDDKKTICYHMKYAKSTMVDPLELFSGYNSLKAITFSFELGFVAKISEMFDTVDVVFGAEFIASKINQGIAAQMAVILANADIIKSNLQNYKNRNFAKKIVDGIVEVRFPKIMVDHRKIYLLKADDGRVRTILTSANMSGCAWNPNHHKEFYVICDDFECYEAFLKDFNTIWSISEPIIPDAAIKIMNDSQYETNIDTDNSCKSEEKTYDVVTENPILSKVNKHVDETIIVQQIEDPEARMEIIHYDKDLENFEQQHKEYLKEIKLKEKNGVVSVLANTVKKYLTNAKKIRQKKITIEERSEYYPRMIIDYKEGRVSVGGNYLDLSPSDEDVRKDIEQLLSIFNNYNRFVGDIWQAQHNHFKLMNAMFSSVFNAKLRCEARLKNIGGVSALPLYMLLNSPPDCGKTFMVKVFLKMMTGIEDFGYKYNDVKSKELAVYQTTHKGIPIFIDEISSSFTLSFSEMIKTPQNCEEKLRENQPMTIFVSNKVSSPQKELRKRMIFLTYDIHLPSKFKRREFETLGTHLLFNMGTAFYRKYLGLMLPYVMDEIEKIITGEGLTNDYSPELMQKSSEIILSLVREYGFEVPDYMKIVTWDDDYADNSRSTYQDSLEEIKSLYKSNRKIFTIDEKFVTICISKDVGAKYCSKWETSLPNEIMFIRIPDAEFTKMRMNRKELEEHLNMKFETGLKAKFLNFIS